ncbi:MAG: hypothetical protein WBD31_03380, partial [Rubripirellula sp.]
EEVGVLQQRKIPAFFVFSCNIPALGHSPETRFPSATLPKMGLKAADVLYASCIDTNRIAHMEQRTTALRHGYFIRRTLGSITSIGL